MWPSIKHVSSLATTSILVDIKLFCFCFAFRGRLAWLLWEFLQVEHMWTTFNCAGLSMKMWCRKYCVKVTACIECWSTKYTFKVYVHSYRIPLLLQQSSYMFQFHIAKFLNFQISHCKAASFSIFTSLHFFISTKQLIRLTFIAKMPWKREKGSLTHNPFLWVNVANVAENHIDLSQETEYLAPLWIKHIT